MGSDEHLYPKIHPLCFFFAEFPHFCTSVAAPAVESFDPTNGARFDRFDLSEFDMNSMGNSPGKWRNSLQDGAPQ